MSDAFEELKAAIEANEDQISKDWISLLPHERTYIKGRVRMFNGIVRSLPIVNPTQTLEGMNEEDL